MHFLLFFFQCAKQDLFKREISCHSDRKGLQGRKDLNECTFKNLLCILLFSCPTRPITLHYSTAGGGGNRQHAMICLTVTAPCCLPDHDLRQKTQVAPLYMTTLHIPKILQLCDKGFITLPPFNMKLNL